MPTLKMSLTVGPGMEVSGLEDEYRLAAGMPRLIYAKNAAQREPRLTRLLEMIETEGVVSYRLFEDAAELGSLVADDLALLLTDRFAGPPAAPPAAPLPLPRRSLVDRVKERGRGPARIRSVPCWPRSVTR